MTSRIPALLALALAAALGWTLLSGDPDPLTEAEARALHDRLLTIDTHIDIGAGYATEALDPGGFTPAQVDLPKMRVGGLDAGFFIVYTAQGPRDAEGYAAARAAAEAKYVGLSRLLRAYPDQVALATSAAEVEAIAQSGRRVMLIGMENAYPLGESVEDVALWAERGVRYVSLTHFGHNQFGGSSNPRADLGDAPEDPGLTDLGRALVAALNDHGVMVDVSHVGRASAMEAIALSRAPVIASHSGAKAVFDNPRNLDDAQLRAIRDKGGVAQMVAYRSYVAEPDPALADALDALRDSLGLTSSAAFRDATPETLAEYRRERAALRAAHEDVTLAQFVDHIDHAVSVAGIDHVGLSGDFDGGGGVAGWDGADDSLNVTLELARRGYTADEIAKLWGRNVLRVMRAVEAAAR